MTAQVLKILAVIAGVSGVYTLLARIIPAFPDKFKIPWRRIGRRLSRVAHYVAAPVVNAVLIAFRLNDRLNRLEGLLKDLEPLTQAGLFALLIGADHTDHEKKFQIIFSHKEDHKAGTRDAPPADEYKAVMRLRDEMSHSFLGGINRVELTCSCACTAENVLDHSCGADIVNASYAIIGSPKHNDFCKALMRRLEAETVKKRLKWEDRYVMDVGPHPDRPTELVAYLKAMDQYVKPEILRPTPTTAPRPEKLTDYAAFIKLPNLLADDPAEHPVIVLAGCKMAGQVALTQWLSDTKNLLYLVQRYAGASRYCYVFFCVEYEYVENGTPKILDIKKMHDDIVTFEAK